MFLWRIRKKKKKKKKKKEYFLVGKSALSGAMAVPFLAKVYQ